MGDLSSLSSAFAARSRIVRAASTEVASGSQANRDLLVGARHSPAGSRLACPRCGRHLAGPLLRPRFTL